MDVHTLLEINNIQKGPGAPPESLLLQESHMKCQKYTSQTHDYQLMGPLDQTVI